MTGRHGRALSEGAGDWSWFADCADPSATPADFIPRASALAKQLCAGCPVRTDCLEYALSVPWLVGYWGGTTAGRRAKIRRQRRAGRPSLAVAPSEALTFGEGPTGPPAATQPPSEPARVLVGGPRR